MVTVLPELDNAAVLSDRPVPESCPEFVVITPAEVVTEPLDIPVVVAPPLVVTSLVIVVVPTSVSVTVIVVVRATVSVTVVDPELEDVDE